jgi:hypothetical protein
MANSSGKQDLIVNILAKDKRYEVANYKNVTIPTNFDLKDDVRERFGEFYAALFDRTVETNPSSVITEYAWTARRGYHCDPCPPLDVNESDMMTLGGDIVGAQIANGFVLTRLHARYGTSDMNDDLRFRAAKAITGGREIRGAQGELEHGAVDSAENYFQARYAIRHYWTGPIACTNPQRNVWGGPPDGNYQPTIAAGKTAFAPRGQLQLASVIKRDLWEINYKKDRPAPPSGQKFATPPGSKAMGFGAGALLAFLVLGLGVFATTRRKEDR